MFRGEVEVKLMNEMGYNAMTIGNHEFDFDLDNMALLFKMAKFPVVCSNYNLDATVLKDLVKPYVILETVWAENRCLWTRSETGRFDSGK